MRLYLSLSLSLSLSFSVSVCGVFLYSDPYVRVRVKGGNMIPLSPSSTKTIKRVSQEMILWATVVEYISILYVFICKFFSNYQAFVSF